jgi:transposase
MEAVRLQAAGVTQREVSRRLGIHIRTIESWQKKKLYQETLRTLSGQVTLASVEKASKSVSVEVLEPSDV